MGARTESFHAPDVLVSTDSTLMNQEDGTTKRVPTLLITDFDENLILEVAGTKTELRAFALKVLARAHSL